MHPSNRAQLLKKLASARTKIDSAIARFAVAATEQAKRPIPLELETLKQEREVIEAELGDDLPENT